MKAYVLHGIDQLRYEDVAYPDCPSGWAIVRVKAAGICSSDIPRIFEKGTYHFPTIPGHEFSGIVDKVSDSEEKRWLGKRVGIFPLIPCKSCKQCQSGHYEMCVNYDYLGSRRDGGFAEYVAVPIWNLMELPNEVSYQTAAMLEPLAVALHAVKRSGLKRENTVAVIGTGMIGFAAAQWAKKLGASKVCVVGRNDSKRGIADGLDGIGYETVSECTEEFDVVIEAVGTTDAVTWATRHTACEGTLILMGNPNGDMLFSQEIYWKILRKQLRITGTWNSSYENNRNCEWAEVMMAVKNYEIKTEPFVSHCLSQEKLAEGLAIMRNHREPYCKVMTVWNSSETELDK